MLAPLPIAATDFRHTLGCFATGVTVVTCQDEAKNAYGVTINSFTSVSLDPPLVLFCLGRQGRRIAAFEQASHYAITILAADQAAVSRHFASTTTDQWQDVQTLDPSTLDLAGQINDSTPPVLAGGAAWLIARRHAVYPGGDHAIILAEVKALAHNRAVSPLVYVHGRYTTEMPR